MSSTRTPRPAVAVTGATGAVGGRVARILASSDVPQRLLARSPERLPALDNAVPCAFSGYGDRVDVAKALRGVETLFMVSAEESADRLDQHRTFVEMAVAAGIQHIVYTSFYGAAADCVFTLGREMVSSPRSTSARPGWASPSCATTSTSTSSPRSSARTA